MKKHIPLIVILTLLLCAVGTGAFFLWNSRTKFNRSYVNGNTAGNLYNTGLFCEDNGTIFFANPSDGHRLYSMGINGTDLKKLSDDVVTYINVDEHYVYYIRTNPRATHQYAFLDSATDSLCRVNRENGRSEVILDQEPSMYASLLGDYIYYVRYEKETASTLYKVKIDASGREQVSDQPFFTCSTNGQYFYHNGIASDHYIWQHDTATDTSRMIYNGNCWMPIVVGSDAYFLDCDNNYALARANLLDGSVTLLTRDRVDCYNIVDNYIFFQKNDPVSPALCRMRTDGTEYAVIAEGNYTDINATSRYVYFSDFSNGTMYYTSITPGGMVNIFNPGAEEEK